jgi:hypothetical protein
MKDNTNSNNDKMTFDVPVQCIFDEQIPTKSCAAVVLWNMGLRCAIGFVAETLHEILASSHWDEGPSTIGKAGVPEYSHPCDTCPKESPDGVDHPCLNCLHNTDETFGEFGARMSPPRDEVEMDEAHERLCDSMKAAREDLPSMKSPLAGCLNQHGNCITCPDFPMGDCLGGITYEDRKVVHMDEKVDVSGCKHIAHLEGPSDCNACEHCDECFPLVSDVDTVDLAEAEMRVAATLAPALHDQGLFCDDIHCAQCNGVEDAENEEYHVESAFAGASVRLDDAFNHWKEDCKPNCKEMVEDDYCGHHDNHVSDCVFKYCPRVWVS